MLHIQLELYLGQMGQKMLFMGVTLDLPGKEKPTFSFQGT